MCAEKEPRPQEICVPRTKESCVDGRDAARGEQGALCCCSPDDESTACNFEENQQVLVRNTFDKALFIDISVTGMCH